MNQERRYWDSDCFLGWLKGEPDKAELCKGVVTGAEKGEILIVTSALTLAEVIKLRHRAPVSRDDAELLKTFFMNDFIRVQNVTRYIAEWARQLVWDNSLDPKDAIHVATALKHNISIFDTFDQDVIKLDGKLGNPLMRIGLPDKAYQTEMRFPSA